MFIVLGRASQNINLVPYPVMHERWSVYTKTNEDICQFYWLNWSLWGCLIHGLQIYS